MEKLSRTVYKSITWRIVALLSSFTVAYTVTGRFDLSSILAISQQAMATIWYWIHERVWSRVDYGINK